MSMLSHNVAVPKKGLTKSVTGFCACKEFDINKNNRLDTKLLIITFQLQDNLYPVHKINEQIHHIFTNH